MSSLNSSSDTRRWCWSLQRLYETMGCAIFRLGCAIRWHLIQHLLVLPHCAQVWLSLPFRLVPRHRKPNVSTLLNLTLSEAFLSDFSSVDFKQVTCPAALTAKTGCVRKGDAGSPNVGSSSDPSSIQAGSSTATSIAPSSSSAQASGYGTPSPVNSTHGIFPRGSPGRRHL